MNTAISEKVSLLGKGLYKDIPDVLTLTSMPTATELDVVGAEDFDTTMLDKILPQVVEEKINFRELLDIDYQWICRCMRIMNYGPYFDVSSIYCRKCGRVSRGEYRVNLNTVGCVPLPEGFINSVKIDKSEFIDFDGDVYFSLMTIQDVLNSREDKAFTLPDGSQNSELTRICYMIKQIKNSKNLTPLEVKLKIQKEFSPADYSILKAKVRDLSNYGLRAGGTTVCPKCGATDASFLAFVDERFFRPSISCLRAWRDDKRAGRTQNIFAVASTNV